MVFGFGKKLPQQTFKQRVSTFWDWYQENSEQLFQITENGEPDEISEFVGPFMDVTLPGLAWVFGPGEPGGHSFTLSGEGNVPKQLLAEYWHSRARQIPRWFFHASRQASSLESLSSMAISVGRGVSVDTVNLLIQPTVDAESESIDIVAWHPAFEQLPESDRLQILFLLLDEALGEFGTEMWLGEISAAPITSDDKTITVATLPEKIQQVNAYYQWEKLTPLHSYSGYEVKKQANGLRGDTIVGSTCIPNIISDFLDNNGRLKDNPLKGTGASFAYLALEKSLLPSGQEVNVRTNIEDAIGDALKTAKSGRTLGGAFGTNHSYIDLLFFDGEHSEQIVNKMLDQLQLTGRAKLAFMG